MNILEVNLYELAELIDGIGGIERIYILAEENEELERQLKISGNENIARECDELRRQNTYLHGQLEIPEEDRMEVTTERLRQIRAKMQRQYKKICELEDENEEIKKELNSKGMDELAKQAEVYNLRWNKDFHEGLSIL